MRGKRGGNSFAYTFYLIAMLWVAYAIAMFLLVMYG